MSEKQSPDDVAQPAKARGVPVAKANPAAATAGQPGSAQAAGGSAAAATQQRPAAQQNPAAQQRPAAQVAQAKAVVAAKAATVNLPFPQESEEEDLSWSGRTLRWMGAAGGVSMMIHMAVLLMLGLWVIRNDIVELTQELVATVADEPREDIEVVLETQVTPATELTTENTTTAETTGVANGSVTALAEPSVAANPTSDAPSEVSIKVGELNIMAATGNKLSKELPQGALKGEALAIADSYSQALDRMTQEIITKLAKGKVLVVWCMDESESMIDDRAEIMSRIGRVYQELGLTEKAKGDALLTGVISYGEKWTNQTAQPTSNIDAIVEAMNSVPVDPSGLEIMCPAISETIRTYRPVAQRTGQRQMMLIVVTDESGDAVSNNQYLETAIADARAANCPLYFLGREAIFGYPFARMRYIDQKTQKPFYAQIDRGPETPFPEQLQIDGLHRRLDALPSGFGSYEQARLARETNGIYFMLPSPESAMVARDPRKYGAEFMRPYLPDLSSRADYTAERDRFEYRQILWKMISDLNPYDKEIDRRVEVQIEFSIEMARLTADTQREIGDARNLIQYLHEAQLALEKVKANRDRDSDHRWRANYDLMYAQTIAYQVRLIEYIAYIETFMKAPKAIVNKFGAEKPTNHWRAVGNKRLMTGTKLQPQIDKATALYKAVMQDHEGTPWEARAQWELKRPYGFEFEERYIAPPSGPQPERRKL